MPSLLTVSFVASSLPKGEEMEAREAEGSQGKGITHTCGILQPPTLLDWPSASMEVR